jgi:hypothetical protein
VQGTTSPNIEAPIVNPVYNLAAASPSETVTPFSQCFIETSNKTPWTAMRNMCMSKHHMTSQTSTRHRYHGVVFICSPSACYPPCLLEVRIRDVPSRLSTEWRILEVSNKVIERRPGTTVDTSSTRRDTIIFIRCLCSCFTPKAHEELHTFSFDCTACAACLCRMPVPKRKRSKRTSGCF